MVIVDALLQPPFVNPSPPAAARNYAVLAVSPKPVSLLAHAPRPAILALEDCQSGCLSYADSLDGCNDNASCLCEVTVNAGVS